MPTLVENRVFAKLTTHVNTGQCEGWSPEKPRGCRPWTVSCKRTQCALNALGTSGEVRAAFRKAHISELLNFEPVDDPIEDLLPEDIYASYLQDPIRETQEEIKFKVYGTAEEQNILLKLLHQYSDVFSDKLGRGAATVTPMKIDVDEAGWYNDKRSREPTRPQAVARQHAINRWIRQAIADNVIRPSEATT